MWRRPLSRPDREARQRAFRRRVLDSGLTVVRVGSPAELELGIYHAASGLVDAWCGPRQAWPPPLTSRSSTGTPDAPSRRRRLRMPAEWPWREELLALLAKLHAIAMPLTT